MTEKKGKFSGKELESVKIVLDGWINSGRCSPADICPALREEGYKRTRAHEQLFQELASMFPNRSKKSIVDCAMRTLIKDHDKKNPWTTEDVNSLRQLVAEKGNKWSTIGRQLGRSGESCRTKYNTEVKLPDLRKKKGFFDREEDMKLEEEVRNMLQDTQSAPQDLDVKGIAWKEIALKMDSQRTGADYARRWLRLVTIFTANCATAPEVDGNNCYRKKKSASGTIDDENKRLLEALAQRINGEHMHDVQEGDVVWIDVERELGLAYGAGHRRYQSMMNKANLVDRADLTFLEKVTEMRAHFNSDSGILSSANPRPSSGNSGSGIKRRMSRDDAVEASSPGETTTSILVLDEGEGGLPPKKQKILMKK